MKTFVNLMATHQVPGEVLFFFAGNENTSVQPFAIRVATWLSL